MKIKSLFVVAALGLSFYMVGCGEAERTYECSQICGRYADCVDSKLDKSDCVDKCEDKGDANSEFEQKATDCENCLDDKSCTEAGASCTTKCAEVVAQSALGQGGAQD